MMSWTHAAVFLSGAAAGIVVFAALAAAGAADLIADLTAAETTNAVLEDRIRELEADLETRP